MPDRLLNILQVSTADVLGGAERVAWNLFQTYRRRGHDSHLAVGRQYTDDPGVLHIANVRGGNLWRRFWWGVHHRAQPHYGRSSLARRVCKTAHRLAEPGGWIDSVRGYEDFHYPGTWRLLDLPQRRPEIVHCHNLHGKYFDLRALPWLSRQAPLMLTLHDAWLLAGHCAHSFSCERWRTACGECPDLTIYPPIRRDATTRNWQRKRELFADSRLYVATPSRWLMSKVERSMLAPAVVEARVIPNGVDLTIFKPAEKGAARDALGLPAAASVLLFAGYGAKANIWKDYETMRGAVRRLADRQADRPLFFLVLGETGPSERIGRAEVRFVPFDADARAVARYYQAADVYVHAARADTFPNSVIESLACGTPVVATAVGGIPEQVQSWSPARPADSRAPAQAETAPTGILAPPCDVPAMADSLERLLNDDALRRQMAANAVVDVRARFDLNRQADAYLDWYAEILSYRSLHRETPAAPVRNLDHACCEG